MLNLMASDFENQILADFRETNAFTTECLVYRKARRPESARRRARQKRAGRNGLDFYAAKTESVIAFAFPSLFRNLHEHVCPAPRIALSERSAVTTRSDGPIQPYGLLRRTQRVDHSCANGAGSGIPTHSKPSRIYTTLLTFEGWPKDPMQEHRGFPQRVGQFHPVERACMPIHDAVRGIMTLPLNW